MQRRVPVLQRSSRDGRPHVPGQMSLKPARSSSAVPDTLDYTVQDNAIQFLTKNFVGTASMHILVVTRMWPTERDRFRNGFVAVQVDALQQAGIACDVLVAQGPRSVFAYAQIAHAVRRALRMQHYDLIHAHYGLTAVTASLQRSCPLVVTFHGSDVMGAVDSTGRRTTKGQIERILSKTVARRANAVIAVSPRLARELPVRDAKVITVGIDEMVFRPCERDAARSQLGLDSQRRYVLFAANPKNAVKRFWLAERAVSQVRARFPDTELLVLHGRKLSEVPTWMNAADVLIITSAYEGGPLVHKEAMACNLPVVSVDVGDVKTRLRGVQQCFVVQDTHEALASALEQVLLFRERSNGRQYIQDLTSTAVAEQLTALYEQVVSGAPLSVSDVA
jgi:glycosyltransferase involved in cell wall biosynthesis